MQSGAGERVSPDSGEDPRGVGEDVKGKEGDSAERQDVPLAETSERGSGWLLRACSMLLDAGLGNKLVTSASAAPSVGQLSTLMTCEDAVQCQRGGNDLHVGVFVAPSIIALLTNPPIIPQLQLGGHILHGLTWHSSLLVMMTAEAHTNIPQWQ